MPARKTYSRKPQKTKRKYVRRKGPIRGSKNMMVNLINRVLYKKAEPKHLSYDHGLIELYHNSGSPASGRILPAPVEPLRVACLPLQGTSDTTRIGDHISVSGIAIHQVYQQKLDRMNVTFRIVVLKCQPNSEPPSINDLIENTTGNILLDSTNRDRGRIVYQKYIKKTITPQLSPAAEQRDLTFTHKFWLPYKRTIRFNADNGQTFSGPQFYIYHFCFDSHGTLVTDNIASVQTFSKLYWRDF